MSNKFGKFLLATAAIGTAAAAAYYFLQKKDSELSAQDETDEDYDDFSDTLDEETETPSRNYVSLTPEQVNKPETAVEETVAKEAAPVEEAVVEEAVVEETTPAEEAASVEEEPFVEEVEETFSSLNDQMNAEETVEEFFDDEENE